MDWAQLLLTLFIGAIVIFLLVVLLKQQKKEEMPESVTFDEHIRPLFRDSDISAMKRFGLDLSDYTQVYNRADDIYARVSDGSMPCDGGWNEKERMLFKRWMDTGKQLNVKDIGMVV